MTTEGAFIRLDQLLKLSGATESGGQAKAMVQSGQVRVNGEVETRRGRKLRIGDTVEAAGKTLVVNADVLARESTEEPSPSKTD